jgi:hypothetical protein
MSQYVPNELDRRLMGVNGLNFADGTDSSPRKQMFSSHIGQCLVVKGGTERYLQTGMERQYAKTTFSVKAPEDLKVIKIIHRYQEGPGIDRIINPETILIYEGQETGEIGMLRLPKYFSDQTYFGFNYQARQTLARLNANLQNATFRRGEILLDSPSVTLGGDYKYGVECNVAYMSHPAVSEDGIMVSRQVLKKFAITTFERREAEWGSRWIPLNLYGDENNYKPFPDIGDVIKPHGILMALRRDDRSLAIVEQSAADLMEIDYHHDRRIYAAGAGGRVKDIKIYHDDYTNSNTPEAMQRQPMRYHRATQGFYKEVLDEINRLDKARDGKIRLSNSLHALAVEAAAMRDNRTNGSQERRVLLHRKNPLDDWRVEFVIEYDFVPDIGNKITDCHGGKGVICKIVDESEMPLDEFGNRADMVMDGNATNSRMNVGRLYEQYINAASRDVAERTRAILGIGHNEPDIRGTINQMEAVKDPSVDQAWDYLMGYIKICSPERMWRWWAEGQAMTFNEGLKVNKHPRAVFLEEVCKSTTGIKLYWPPNNEPEFPDIVRQCERSEGGMYKPVYTPVTYVGNSGRTVKTINRFMIGSVYIIMLEKIADDWTAVASGKLQHYGVLSQITSWDKYSQPTRNQAIRAWGESEIRILVSFGGMRVTADILDRNNNPKTRRHILDTILNAPYPTNIDQVVDRRQVPYGGNKPLQLVKHMAECAGWCFKYQQYDPNQGGSGFASADITNVTFTATVDEEF